MQDLEYAEKTENHEKWETHSVGRKIWRKTLNNLKNKKYILQDLNYDKKTEKNLDNETQTLQDMARNTQKSEKSRCTHCKTWNMARNTQKCG